MAEDKRVNFIETEYGIILSTSYIKRVRRIGVSKRRNIEDVHWGKALIETFDDLRHVSSQDFDVVAKLLESNKVMEE
jgi:hypothetical protein